MHTSFEGKIGRIDEHGSVEWTNPKRDEPWAVVAAIALAMAFPLAFCVAFYALG